LKKLAIVGSGPNTRHLAPFYDLEYDIWVFNEAANRDWCKRWTACFQIHPEDIYKGHNTKDAKHWDWLQQSHSKPIYMQEVDPLIPDGVRFPLNDAFEVAGADIQMFSTTFAYMAALAIMQGYKKVSIFGVELSATEYKYQKDSYMFWMGFLRGRLGAENVDNAVLYGGVNIFNVPLYGYDGNFAFGVDYFSERAKILESEWTAANKSLSNIRQAIDRAIENKKYEKAQRLVMEYQSAALSTGESAGALAEAQRYQTFGDRFADRGGFESAAAQAQQIGEEKKPLVWHYGGMIEYVWNVWKQSEGKQGAKQMVGMIETMGKTAYDTGAMLGAFKENLSYIAKYDAVCDAGGAVLLENK
jgi:hypothetical protein